MCVNKNSFIGKYYNEPVLSDAEKESIIDNKRLSDLENLWISKSESLEKEISLLEKLYEEESDVVLKSDMLKHLKELYEKFKVANIYRQRFCTVNNLPLLEKLYNKGKFVLLNEAELFVKEYDDKIYFSSNSYKQKESVSKALSIIVGISSAFILFPYILGCIGGEGYTFFSGLVLGYLMMGTFGVVLIPLNFIFSAYLIPKLIRFIISPSGKYSKEYIKQCNKTSNIAIGAGIAAGLTVQNHTNKSGDPKFEDE